MTILSRIKSIFSKDTKEKNIPSDDMQNNDSYFEDEDGVVVESAADYKQKLKSPKSNFKPEAKEGGGFDWFSDRYETLVVQRNVAIFLLIIAVLCIGLTGVSLAVITKSKTIEPFVIEIEKKQGIVTYVDNNTKAKEYTQDEVLRNYFIKKYIDARETFDPVNYDYFYYKVVKAMSNDSTYRQFLYTLKSTGKDNPMVAFARNEISRVEIVSVSVLKPQVVQVRFVVEARFPEGNVTRVNRIAVVEYEYSDLATDESKRYINPLSFIVNSYRATDENVQQ